MRISSLAAAAMVTTLTSSCEQENIKPVEQDNAPVVGVVEFMNSTASAVQALKEMSQDTAILTRAEAGEIDAELQQNIDVLINESLVLREMNGIDVDECLNEFGLAANDPAIALSGLALVEYELNNSDSYKGITAGENWACVLTALGLTDLAHTVGKRLIKRVVKEWVKRAIPVVGTAFVVYGAALCLYNAYNNLQVIPDDVPIYQDPGNIISTPNIPGGGNYSIGGSGGISTGGLSGSGGFSSTGGFNNISAVKP